MKPDVYEEYDLSERVEDYYSPKLENMDKNKLKRHLISAGVTFGSTFFTVFAIAISVDSFTFTQEALIATSLSALIAGVRAVAKLIVEWNMNG